MTTNLIAIFVCGILSMVIGFIWYGPLFGKKWAEIVGANLGDIEKRKEMHKKAGPLYLVQFLMTLFQIYVLNCLIHVLENTSPIVLSIWIYLAFVIPIVAGSAMWNNDSKKVAWTRFLLQAGYQLILFVMFGLILGTWK